jgi:hypothetical protein
MGAFNGVNLNAAALVSCHDLPNTGLPSSTTRDLEFVDADRLMRKLFIPPLSRLCDFHVGHSGGAALLVITPIVFAPTMPIYG